MTSLQLLVLAALPGLGLAAAPDSHAAGCQFADSPDATVISDTLNVVTLNIAHGRGTSINQMLVTRTRHVQNLNDVTALLVRADAHVVALQEADGPSLWSGRFDHVGFLAEATKYGCLIHGHHADSWLYSFGTALISRARMVDAVSHPFEPSFFTPTKGFVRGTIQWPSHGTEGTIQPVTIVSVHLDYSRRKVRQAQIAEMSGALSSISTPLIVMGDFNEDWSEEHSAVRKIASTLNLAAYRPATDDLGTYNKTKRQDWILISEELQFADYAVLPDTVSDHMAVVARNSRAPDQ